MRTKFTPEKIESVKDLNGNGIFVFGSNINGEHCGGAAYVAATKFGAVEGQGFGLQGMSYAIPTCIRLAFKKDEKSFRYTKPFESAEAIKPFITIFINDAELHPELTFYVTKIGCGIAGFKVEEIAELFRPCLEMENVILPKEFVDYLSI